MVDYKSGALGAIVSDVQLTGFENAAYLGNDRNVEGMPVANENWGSPEAICRGLVNKPTDVFSFGLVVSNREQKLT